MYRWILTDTQGTPLAELEGAQARKYSLVLNGAGVVSFDCDGRDPKAELIREGESEIHVYRHGEEVQAGQVRTVQKDISADGHKVSVTAVGYFGLLEHRHLRATRTYTATDQGQIAWDMINYTQTFSGGNLGITQGSIPASVNRDRNYDAGKNIAEAIKQLSEVQGGFDFEVTPGKVFNVYYPFRGIYLTDYIFELGKNVREFREGADASPEGLANWVMATGTDTAGNPITATASNAASVERYGIRERVESTDIKEQTTLQARADELVDKYKQHAMTYELTVEPSPDPGSYSVGDWIRIRARDGCLNIDDKFLRLIAYEVSIDDNDVETVKLSVAEKHQLAPNLLRRLRTIEQRLGNLER